jgi:sugar phosphate isomerase/epimerase
MKMSLSVRVAESPKRKDVAAIPIEALAPQAKVAGFQGLSIRASVVSIDSPPERVVIVRSLLNSQNLDVSMVTGTLALAVNNADAADAIRNITPHLNLAEQLDSKLVRVMLHETSDIAFASRAADEAAERGLTLCQQMHWGSLFETVNGALEALAAIDRKNFGVTYEPANLLACGDTVAPDNIRRLAPYLVNVYFQNIQLDENSPVTFDTRRNGPVGIRFIPIDASGGIDLPPLIQTLKEVGYDGWFTVHQPLLEGQSVDAVIRQSAAFISPLLN